MAALRLAEGDGLGTMVSWNFGDSISAMVYIIKGDTIYHGKKHRYPGKGDGFHGDSS